MRFRGPKVCRSAWSSATMSRATSSSMCSRVPVFGDDNRTAAAAIQQHAGDGSNWLAVIDGWDEVSGAFDQFVDWAVPAVADGRCAGAPLSGARLLAPIPAPYVRIFAVAPTLPRTPRSAEGAISGDDSGVAARTAELLDANRAGVPPWGFNVLPHTLIGSRRGRHSAERRREGRLTKVREHGGTSPQRPHAGTPGGVGSHGLEHFSIRDPHFGLGRRIDEGPLTWSLQKNWSPRTVWSLGGRRRGPRRAGLDLLASRPAICPVGQHERDDLQLPRHRRDVDPTSRCAPAT